MSAGVATGTKLACTSDVPGRITVANRSTRHVLAVPPKRSIARCLGAMDLLDAARIRHPGDRSA